MKGLTIYERRNSIANDEIIEDYNSSSVFLSGRSIGGSSEPNLNQVSAKRINNEIDSRLIAELQMCQWRIEDRDVSEIPEIYPRLSYPLIVRDRKISEIGDRLWTFLRTHGIRSAYDKEQGRVLCCTERVGFVVQIWRRSRSFSEDTKNNIQSVEEIVLEIQRRKGCSWTMQKIRLALKRSIIQKQQLSQSLPDLQNRQQSQTSKPAFFPPPLQRHRSSNAIGMMEPLIHPSRFLPLLQSDESTTKKSELPTKEDSSPTSAMSWKEGCQKRRKNADLPSPFCFPPPLRQNF